MGAGGSVVAASSAPSAKVATAFALDNVTPSSMLTNLPEDIEGIECNNFGVSSAEIPWLRLCVFSNTLSSLVLSGNKLTSVGWAALGQLDRLATLDLSRNEIYAPAWRVLGMMPALRHVDLGNNKITSVSWTDLTALLPRLQHLDLQNNPVENLPPKPLSLDVPADVLEYVEAVGKANASSADTRVQAVSAARLDTLDLSARDATACLTTAQIPWRRMSSLLSVTAVSFAHNLLTSVDMAALSALPSLCRLDIAHNLLASFPWDGLASLAALEELDLSGNEIKTVEWETLGDHPALQSVSVQGNPVRWWPHELGAIVGCKGDPVAVMRYARKMARQR